MIALEGIIKNNTIVINNDISEYDGSTVIVTILDNSYATAFKNNRNGDMQTPEKNEIKAGREDDSFHKILQLKKGFHFDKDFNADKEIEEAVGEKYGRFA